MSTTAYHHGHLREALVEAAVEAVRERGADGLALRDLARRVGVSHNAAYRHFAGRDDLVGEVAGRVMRRLVDTMQLRLSEVDSDEPVLRARRRLAATGRAYVEFALAEPGLFRLTFASLPVMHATAPPPERDPYAVLGQCLDDLVAVGHLSAEARVDADVACWAAVHGFAALAVDGALHDLSVEARDAALERLLATIDRSYAASTGAEVDAADLAVR